MNDRYTDSHAHIDLEHFGEDRKGALARAREVGVTSIINIISATDVSVFRESMEFTSGEEGVWAAAAVHPHDASKASGSYYDEIISLAGSSGKFVAIGETGLDYHYDYSPRDEQIKAFRRQISMAREIGLPLIIHNRNADGDTCRILEEERAGDTGGVIHCFSGDIASANRYIELGFHVSIPGIVTFKDAGSLTETAKKIREDRLLIETDSPYLTPHPLRGKKNEPAYVRYVARKIAEIRDLSESDVGRITTVNAIKLFGMDRRDFTPALSYAIRDSLYLNVTNKCTLHCTFCGKFRDFTVKGHNLKVGKDPVPELILAVIAREDLSKYKEVVFCGYGEPLLRLDVVKEIARFLKSQNVKVRINTDGLANLIHNRDITAELKGLVDTVSVSLNAADPSTYAKYCKSRFGEEAFPAVQNFILSAKRNIPEVIATMVGLEGIVVEAVRRLAEEKLGVKFRFRAYNEIG